MGHQQPARLGKCAGSSRFANRRKRGEIDAKRCEHLGIRRKRGQVGSRRTEKADERVPADSSDVPDAAQQSNILTRMRLQGRPPIRNCQTSRGRPASPIPSSAKSWHSPAVPAKGCNGIGGTSLPNAVYESAGCETRTFRRFPLPPRGEQQRGAAHAQVLPVPARVRMGSDRAHLATGRIRRHGRKARGTDSALGARGADELSEHQAAPFRQRPVRGDLGGTRHLDRMVSMGGRGRPPDYRGASGGSRLLDQPARDRASDRAEARAATQKFHS